MKPGVNWVEMHLVAERAILRHLLRLGLCVSTTQDEEEAVNELMENKVRYVWDAGRRQRATS